MISKKMMVHRKEQSLDILRSVRSELPRIIHSNYHLLVCKSVSEAGKEHRNLCICWGLVS